MVRLHDFLQLSLANSWPGVPHVDSHNLALSSAGDDNPATIGVLYCVADQISKDRGDDGLVAYDARTMAREPQS